jgi:DNA invertase Pin-like site-specific DNA recombinase
MYTNKYGSLYVPKVRRIGYTRVSSNSAEQLQALEQHKARLNAAGCDEVYWDIGSRSKHNRKGLNTVLEIIKQQECDEAVFIRIDRMTDSPTVLEKAITICLQSKIPIRGLDDHIDFTTVGGRLHARILCNLARAEVERLSERIQHGHEYHRQMNAAYFPPFGYKKVDQHLELDLTPFICLLETKEELSKAAIGYELVETFFSTRSLRGTLKQFNDKYGIRSFCRKTSNSRKSSQSLGFSISGLTAWLNNPILRGHIAYGRAYKQRNSHKHLWDIRYNIHPEHRIITDEQYQVIDSTLDWNSKHRSWRPKETHQIHPLSGLVRCADCMSLCRGLAFRLRTDRSLIRHSYQCSNYRLKACNQKKSLRNEIIELQVVQSLIDRAAQVNRIVEQTSDKVDPPEIQKLKAELAFYKNAPGDRAAGIVLDIEQQIQNFRDSHNRSEGEQSARMRRLVHVFGDPQYWSTLPITERRDTYRELVSYVTIREGSVDSVVLKV